MKKKKVIRKKVVSSRPIMEISGNRVMLKGYKIKNVELVPQWEIKTTEETTPIYNETGEAMGVTSRFLKESTIRFFPDIKKEVEGSEEKEGD